MAPTIPLLPGVYRFVSEEGEILYVGKAKSLRNRLSNYFGSIKSTSHKTMVLTRHASHIEYTIVDTEHDALLLENTLIKKHQPRYNVMLKDGKSYAYIVVKNERFPRVFLTRRLIKDKSYYFGPYTSIHKVRIIMEVIKKLFPLRTCNLALTQSSIEQSKFKVCLEYHIKNCGGPCQGFESEEAYNRKIDQVKNILKGNFARVRAYIHQEMDTYAEKLEFEQAQFYKDKLLALDEYHSKSTVVSTTIVDLDVFSMRTDDKMAFVNYTKIVDGSLIHSENFELEKNLDDDETILTYIIPIVREQFQSVAKEIALPFEIPLSEDVTVIVPQRGDKRKLLELSHKNLDYYLSQRRKKEAEQTKQSSSERILTTLQNDLQMNELPMHIECFDNSNIQGSNPVASCVVFKNAKPSKKDYRHFKIKTVEGPNDFASMEEIIYRRYHRLLEENEPLPQLVIIDGGKGQLSAAMKSITALGLQDKFTVVGIAKRLEEIFFPTDNVPLYINKKSESLKLIQFCRNEAHRFALNFHRDLRSKNFILTELSEINGVGDKTAQKLLKTFGSVKTIKASTLEALTEVVGKVVAQKIFDYFEKQNG